MHKKAGWQLFAAFIGVPAAVSGNGQNKTKAPARDWKLTEAQQKLELLGYDVDRKDGRISKDTTEAIKNSRGNMGWKKRQAWYQNL